MTPDGAGTGGELGAPVVDFWPGDGVTTAGVAAAGTGSRVCGLLGAGCRLRELRGDALAVRAGAEPWTPLALGGLLALNGA